MSKEIAILMAAGKGERLRPITANTPKPLVKVNGVSMIETVISGLNRRGVERIYVVVGYLKEKFSYLPTKYKNLTLIENTEYLVKNNISSIRAVCDILGTANCFILEADLVVSDASIFDAELKNSCYYGKMVKGHSDDWVFFEKDGKISKITKGGDNVYNMVGVSYFLKDDAKLIKDEILKAYKTAGHETLYWDEIVDRLTDKMTLTVHPVKKDQLIEIDTVNELIEVDGSYKNLI